VIIELKYRSHIQRMTYEDFESRVRDGEIASDLQVRFDAVTGDRFVPVGDLELYGQLVDPGRRKFRDNMTRPGIPLLTAILVGLQIRIYLASWAPGAEDWLQTEWTNWAPAILERGEVWRLFSYGLLHVGFTHLLFNLTFLAYTGYNLERALGRLNLAVLYFGSVFFGGTISMWMSPGRPSLGASGGDFGLMAAAVVFGWKHWDDIPIPARTKFGWALVPYLIFSLVSGLSAENVDNWGHLGGLMTGAILMTILAPALSPRVARRNRLICWGAIGCCGAVIALLWVGGTGLLPLKPHTEGSWTVPVPSYWREGWTHTGDRGWFSPTGDATMVVTRTVHDRPLGPRAAVDKLVDRIGLGSAETGVVERAPIRIAGVDGEALTMHFQLAGEPKVVRAVVLTRGVVAYRAHIQTRHGLLDRYGPVLDRALTSATLDKPEDLMLAAERSATHPRSWQPAVELGDALYRAGQPKRALVAYERALTRAPDQSRALVGRLRVYAHYGLSGGLDLARQTLAQDVADPRVIVAAVELLDAVGAEVEAGRALDQAWVSLGGDGIIRRARLRRGMAVED
jgi:rhomboid protease GluP